MYYDYTLQYTVHFLYMYTIILSN